MSELTSGDKSIDINHILSLPLSDVHEPKTGLDSTVYVLVGGDYVKKVYQPYDRVSGVPLGSKLLERYRDLTNKAAEVDIPLELSPLENKKIEVNPILGVQQQTMRDGSLGNMVSVSRYIEGDTLKEYTAQRGIKYRETTEKLERLGEFLAKKLDLPNLWLTQINMKVLEDKIVITDLCASILDIKSD